MAEEGSAKDTLAMELRFAGEWSQPVQGEEGTDIYKGMSTIFFNQYGDVKLVQGAAEMKKAIDEGFIYTREDADKFPAPRMKLDEKVFKRSNNILDAYGSGGLSLLMDADEEALNYIKQAEALNKLSPNYDPMVSSAAGYIRRIIPRSETAEGVWDRLMGGADIKVEYDPSSNQMLPKPRPTLAERLMKQGE